MNWW